MVGVFHNKEIEVYIFHMKKMVGGASYNNEIEFRLNPGKRGESGRRSSSIGFDLFRNPCEKSSSPEKNLERTKKLQSLTQSTYFKL